MPVGCVPPGFVMRVPLTMLTRVLSAAPVRLTTVIAQRLSCR